MVELVNNIFTLKQPWTIQNKGTGSYPRFIIVVM